MKFNAALKFRTLWLMLLATAGCGLPAWSEDAATPGYHIEIIVFRANSAQGGGENWSSEAGSGNTVGEESSSGSSQVGHFISALSPEQFQLSDLESKLRSSGETRISNKQVVSRRSLRPLLQKKRFQSLFKVHSRCLLQL